MAGLRRRLRRAHRRARAEGERRERDGVAPVHDELHRVEPGPAHLPDAGTEHPTAPQAGASAAGRGGVRRVDGVGQQRRQPYVLRDAPADVRDVAVEPRVGRDDDRVGRDDDRHVPDHRPPQHRPGRRVIAGEVEGGRRAARQGFPRTHRRVRLPRGCRERRRVLLRRARLPARPGVPFQPVR